MIDPTSPIECNKFASDTLKLTFNLKYAFTVGQEQTRQFFFCVTLNVNQPPDIPIMDDTTFIMSKKVS